MTTTVALNLACLFGGSILLGHATQDWRIGLAAGLLVFFARSDRQPR